MYTNSEIAIQTDSTIATRAIGQGSGAGANDHYTFSVTMHCCNLTQVPGSNDKVKVALSQLRRRRYASYEAF